MKFEKTRLRAWLLNGRSLSAQTFAVAVILAVSGAPAMSQTLAALVVQSDRGGLIGQRSQQISALRAVGQRVELRGTCLSACTMYLGLQNVCVSASASFGFHGPKRDRRPLTESEFNHFSKLMANNYREPLRSWFMSEGRYRTSGYFGVSGSELIRIGYQEC